MAVTPEIRDSIVNMVVSYSQGASWADIIMESKEGIIDLFAKMCYQKMLANFWGKSEKDGVLVVEDKEAFGHLVMSHSFMEFLLVSGLIALPQDVNSQRPIYDRFCKINNVPPELIEIGWKEYKED